jgi:hypothetical protein
MIKANGFRSSSVVTSTSNRKYRDVSARCIRFGPYFLTMEIMNFIQRLTITTENAWATRPLLPLGFTGGVTLIRNMIVILKASLKYYI